MIVHLTPRKDAACIDVENARQPTFVRWVLEKLSDLHDPVPYPLVAGFLGLEQMDTLVVMAAASVGIPEWFELISQPGGERPTGELGGLIVEQTMKLGLGAGLYPLLRRRPFAD